MRIPAASLAAALLVSLAGPLLAQAPAPDFTLTEAIRQQVVESLAASLEQRYVFPEVGNRMAADLRARLRRGEYTALNGGQAFATALTTQMRAISHDQHLGVHFRDDADTHVVAAAPSPAELARQTNLFRQVNFGFERAQRLRGNVGYLDLRFFVDTADAGATARAALRFLGNTDALIIDLRQNEGGEPAMVALIASALFPAGEKVHLNDLRWRLGDRVEQFYTDPALDLPHFTGAVYVLTSRDTFSAAEEFVYDLKQLKRATQVGETTAGAANPGEGVTLHPRFGVFIPAGRAVNPISGDNWEGKGCVPEIPVEAGEALRAAHIKALEGLLPRVGDAQDRADMTQLIGKLRSGPPES